MSKVGMVSDPDLGAASVRRLVSTRAEEEYDAMRIHEIDIYDYARQLR